MQSAECKVENAKWKMRNEKCKMRNEKCKVGAGTEINRRSFIKFLLGSALATTSFRTALGANLEPIKIGLLADLSGNLAVYGYWNQKAIQAAIDRLRNQGGIGGRDVKLFIADTKTDDSTGISKMRRLILSNGVDFVIGSQDSGVSLACNPIAEEQETIHFPLGEATDITAGGGNRYSFKMGHTTLSHAQVAYEWAVENLGKKWTIAVADYSFGRAHAAEWPPLIEKVGGEVLKILTVPMLVSDFYPYLTKVDQKDTEVLLNVFPGSLFPRFIQSAHEIGLPENMEILGPICSPDGFALDMEAAEGSWWISNYPRLSEEVPARLRPYDELFRQAVEVDKMGREIGTGRVTTGSHYWYGWSIVFLLKEAIEETSWETKKDNPQLIKALEGKEVTAGPGFPQGDAFIRAADHQGFHDHYIERVEEGYLRVKEHIDKEKAVYEPTVNYT